MSSANQEQSQDYSCVCVCVCGLGGGGLRLEVHGVKLYIATYSQAIIIL